MRKTNSGFKKIQICLSFCKRNPETHLEGLIHSCPGKHRKAIIFKTQKQKSAEFKSREIKRENSSECVNTHNKAQHMCKHLRTPVGQKEPEKLPLEQEMVTKNQYINYHLVYKYKILFYSFCGNGSKSTSKCFHTHVPMRRAQLVCPIEFIESS